MFQYLFYLSDKSLEKMIFFKIRISIFFLKDPSMIYVYMSKTSYVTMKNYLSLGNYSD